MHLPRFSVPAEILTENQDKDDLKIWYYQTIRFDRINSLHIFRNNSASENK